MPLFDNRDVTFDAPDGWKDQSVVVFEGPRSHGVAFATNVTLSRVPVGNQQQTVSLTNYATQQVASIARTLPNFELVSQQNVMFGGLPAVELLFHWRADDSAVTQRITIFERAGVLWSFAASSLRATFAENLPGFERIASTLKFPNDVPPATPSGNLPPTSRSLPGDREKPRGW